MPEGHIIHHYARRHTKQLGGRPIDVSSPQGRFAAGAKAVDGQVLEGVEAYGKHLFYGFEPLVHVHLGLRGNWFRTDGQDPRPSVRMRLNTDDVTWDLIAPIACELYSPQQRAELFNRLGPDPLRRDADPDKAWEALHRSRVPIGAALLDQSNLSGVGNVLRNELLYEFRIHPSKPANTIDRDTFDAMWARLVAVMRASASKGRIVFSGSPERWVYKRESCFTCGTPIKTETIGGRNAYVCPTCQR